MRTIMLTVLLAAVATQAVDVERYVVPKKDGVGVFANEIRKLYEEPLCKVGMESRLVVVNEDKGAYRIRTAEGSVGWVEKALVAAARAGTQFQFGSAGITGWLDNPQFIVIQDKDDSPQSTIILDRSFRDNLSDNIDREMVERSSH